MTNRKIEVKNPRPADFALGSLASRVAARNWLQQIEKRVQVIVCGTEPSPFEAACCSIERYSVPTGEIIEIIMADRDLSQLAPDEDVELERLVRRTPIRNSNAQLNQ